MFRFNVRRTPVPTLVTDRQAIQQIADEVYLAVIDKSAQVLKDSRGQLMVRSKDVTARIGGHTSRPVDLSHVILRKPQFRGS